MTQKIILESTLTCLECGHVKTETMPTNACQWFGTMQSFGCGSWQKTFASSER